MQSHKEPFFMRTLMDNGEVWSSYWLKGDTAEEAYACHMRDFSSQRKAVKSLAYQREEIWLRQDDGSWLDVSDESEKYGWVDGLSQD